MPDVLIHDATVLTADPRNRLYERGTVVVDDGGITAVRPSEPGDETVDAGTVIGGADQLVMPELVNAHAHLEISALVGGFSELLANVTALCEQLGRGEYEYLVETSCELAALNAVQGGPESDDRPGSAPERYRATRHASGDGEPYGRTTPERRFAPSDPIRFAPRANTTRSDEPAYRYVPTAAVQRPLTRA